LTKLSAALALLIAGFAASGCALHDRQAMAIRMLEERMESTPVVPDVVPPH
jgi:hypothetical protein